VHEGAPCDADVLVDSENCGACGHDCRGGACEQGTCRPVLVKGVSADYMLPAGSAAYAFVSSYPGPDVYRVDRASEQVDTADLPGAGTYGLRVMPDFVYFADYGGLRVLRAPSTGPFALSALVDTSALSNLSLTDVFVDDDAIYFPDACGNGEKLWRADLDGSNPSPAAVELPCLSEVEADATDLWAVSAVNATVYRIPKSGSPVDAGFAPAENLSGDSSVVGSGLELDADHVWVSLLALDGNTSTDTGIHRFRKDGNGPPEQLVAAPFVTHMTRVGTELYWVDQVSKDEAIGQIGRIDGAAPSAKPEILFAGLPAPIGLVVYDDVIYFTAFGAGGHIGGIYRVVR
jgi:hypothetical protein